MNAPASFPLRSIERPKPSLGLIGLGAFGAFLLPHLASRFAVVTHDPASGGGLEAAARADIVVLAVPFDAIGTVARDIAPFLRPGAVVVDCCSIKERPLAILRSVLPDHVEIVGTHPLFGPESGRAGLAGLRIAICEPRGRSARRIAAFLKAAFGLRIHWTTPEAHDLEMAHVQALTHAIARALAAMNLPALAFRTQSYDHLMRMRDLLRHDSDALYDTITRENRFAPAVLARFREALDGVLPASSRPS